MAWLQWVELTPVVHWWQGLRGGSKALKRQTEPRSWARGCCLAPPVVEAARRPLAQVAISFQGPAEEGHPSL